MKYGKVIKVSLWIILICATFFGSCRVFSDRARESLKTTITEKPADYSFPVVVITPVNATVIFGQGELSDFINYHSDYSFSIPNGQLQRVSQQITNEYKQSRSKAIPYLEVQELGQGKQMVKLSLYGSPRNEEYWYEAKVKDFVPRARRVEGALDPRHLWILPASVLIAALSSLFVYFLGRSAIKFILELRGY